MTDAYNRWWVAQMGRPPLPEEHDSYERGREIFEQIVPRAKRLSEGLRTLAISDEELDNLWSSLAELRDRVSALEAELEEKKR